MREQVCVVPARRFGVSYVDKTDAGLWRVRHQLFDTRDDDMCLAWVKAINDRLDVVQGGVRPSTLLVFTNPFGGHGTASEIYAHSVRPVLVAAGVRATLISTKSGGHAAEYIKTHTDLDAFDGIVVVGGDGFFHEVVNALVQTGNNSKRVGLIPGGSTNTIVYSLHGTLDPGTAAMHIVLGERMPLDLCRTSSMDNKVC